MSGPTEDRPVPIGAGRLSLQLDDASGAAPRFVSLLTQDPSLLSSIGDWVEKGGALRSILWISVDGRHDQPDDDALPPMSGRYTLSGNGIRFTPHFPFQQGLHHRVNFDPRPLGCPGYVETATFGFSLPARRGDLPVEVEHIFPSTDELPENLLRFYVCFSQPMQRGHAEREVLLLGPDGQPVRDVLYRAPAELWDRSMRCLTVLLDPGRLKRGVGPNRDLGPPLRVGQAYMLAIGTGMTGSSGRRLFDPVYKRFSVMKPVHEPIAASGWEIVPPVAGTCTPLLLRFVRPLDWALLRQAVTVTTVYGEVVQGRVEIEIFEKGLGFRPTKPWAAKPHQLSIAAELEDVCGNTFGGPFDRPLRNLKNPADLTLPLLFPFRPPAHSVWTTSCKPQ